MFVDLVFGFALLGVSLALAEGGRYYSISGQTASGRPFKGMIRKDFFDGQLAAGAIVPASK